MPVLRVLPNHKTKYFPLKPVMKNESTTSNNIHIIEDIYIRQFTINSQDSIHSTRLRLVYGDLKTFARIQAAKALRHSTSEQAFSKFDWLLPGLGLWHLRLNMLQLIHRIHWGRPEKPDHSSLQYAADKWQRTHVVQANEFQALEDLIIHSYQSRIVGLWVGLLRRDKQHIERIEDTLPWLAGQTRGPNGSWLRVLQQISDIIHINPVSHADLRNSRDQEFENHQNYCALVEIYLTLKYAIKHGDIYLLRHVLRRVAVVFQADVAGTPKYRQALLYTLHLIDTPAASTRLQDCVLMNSLVNLQGVNDSNFELDRLLELLNNSLKAFQQERSYFSKNSDLLLEHWALNGPYLVELKGIVEFQLGKSNSARHAMKLVDEDLWSMALSLAHGSLQKSARDRFVLNPTSNLHQAGLLKLGENVFKYNQQNEKYNVFADDLDEDEIITTNLNNISTPLSPTLAMDQITSLSELNLNDEV